MDSELRREPFAIVGSLYKLKVDWFRPDTDKVFEEVTIDYEAAGKRLASFVTHTNIPITTKLVGHWIHEIVDAALTKDTG